MAKFTWSSRRRKSCSRRIERLEEGPQALREAGAVADLPPARDAELRFIGNIPTPSATREAYPRQGDPPGAGVPCGPGRSLGAGPRRCLQDHDRIELLCWFHLSRRDVMVQHPTHDGRTFGTFALRSPLRPNRIATSIVELVRIEGAHLFVRGLDCLDGTPLLDIKPDRCAFSPRARG